LDKIYNLQSRDFEVQKLKRERDILTIQCALIEGYPDLEVAALRNNAIEIVDQMRSL
jgi:hypothetical protein